MTPTIAEVKAHVVATVEKMVSFSNTYFDIDISNLKLNISFGTHNVRIGQAGLKKGKPFMDLILGNLIKSEVIGYNEYPSVAKFRMTSAFYTTDWKLWVDALIAHEMAHVVQFVLPISNSSLKAGNKRFVKVRKSYSYVEDFTGLGTFESGHGLFFVKIYSILRNEFVNSRVTKFTSEKIMNFAEDLEDKIERKGYQETHRLIGTKVKVQGHIYEIEFYKPRNNKFPMITKKHPVTGKTFKLAIDYCDINKVIS